MENIGGWFFSVCAGVGLLVLLFWVMLFLMPLARRADDAHEAGIGLGEGKE